MDRGLKTALVTGASRGIGKAIAERLVTEGYKVHGTSRDPKTIKKEDKIKGVTYHALDVGKVKSCTDLIAKIQNVDLLINNAGISQIGPLEEVPMKKVHELFELNMFGIIRLIQGFLPGMRKRKKGFIINVSSMAGKFAVPFSGVYAATKHGLEGLTWSLKNEVYKYGVEVCTIAPAYIKTTIPQVKMYDDKSPYIENLNLVKAKREESIAHGPDPKVVGDKIVKILKAKNIKPSYPIGGSAKRNTFFRKALPDRLLIKMIRKSFNMVD